MGDGGRLLVRLEGSCSTAQLFSAHRNCAFTIRKQPCYWASLFTAANATEQDRYLMARRWAGTVPRVGRAGRVVMRLWLAHQRGAG